MNKIAISLISIYQKYLSFDHGILMTLAPGGACKFSPTCSEYTKQMIEEFGIIKGLPKSIRRIISCR